MSIRFQASMVGYEVGTLVAGCLWDSHRKMKRVLVDCHRLIVGDGSKGRMRADPG